MLEYDTLEPLLHVASKEILKNVLWQFVTYLKEPKRINNICEKWRITECFGTKSENERKFTSLYGRR